MLNRPTCPPPRNPPLPGARRRSLHPYERQAGGSRTDGQRCITLPARFFSPHLVAAVEAAKVPTEAEADKAGLDQHRLHVAQLHAKFMGCGQRQASGLKAHEWRELATFVAGGLEGHALAATPQTSLGQILSGWQASTQAQKRGANAALTPSSAAGRLLQLLSAAPHAQFANDEQVGAARALAACWATAGQKGLELCAELLASRGQVSLRADFSVTRRQAPSHGLAELTAAFEGLVLHAGARRSHDGTTPLLPRPPLRPSANSRDSSLSGGEPWVVVSGGATPEPSRTPSPFVFAEPPAQLSPPSYEAALAGETKVPAGSPSKAATTAADEVAPLAAPAPLRAATTGLVGSLLRWTGSR